MFQVTKDFLVLLMPESSEMIEPFVEHLVEMFRVRNINTSSRIASFLCQTGHESVRFTTMAQTLNYSTKGLLRVFPQFFTAEQAMEYAHKPLRIASRVYAGRFGNRDESSTDGWWYRPRGLTPRILGAAGYRKCAEGLLQRPTLFLQRPELLSGPEWSCKAAGWFWDSIEGNDLSDQDTEQSFRTLTRRINGGLHGLQDRLFLFNKAKALIDRGTIVVTQISGVSKLSEQIVEPQE